MDTLLRKFTTNWDKTEKKRGRDRSRDRRGEFGAANVATLTENQFVDIIPEKSRLDGVLLYINKSTAQMNHSHQEF